MNRITLACAAAAALTWGAASAQSPAPAPDLVLHGGKVVTVDERFSVAQALAVRGDRIVAVGSDATVRALAGPATRQIDLRGRTVIPGLMDGHLHNAGGGPGVDLASARTIEELLQSIADRVKVTRPGDVVISNSDWHEAQLKEQRLPHLRELDRVAPDHPVVLVRGGHQYVINSAAARRWNISRETVSPAGGQIGKDADGGLNGELVNNARNLVQLPPAARLVREDILAQQRILNAAGLTGIRIPGSFTFGSSPVEAWRLFKELHAEGLLTLRVNFLFRIADYSSPEKIREQVRSWGARPGEGDEWLRVDGVKTMLDGGFEGGLMRQIYDGIHSRGGTFRGIQVVPAERHRMAVTELNRLGWRVTTHVVGDLAADQALDNYAAADREVSLKGRRWALEHLFIGRSEHFERIKALDMVVSAQNHLYLAGPSVMKYWGRERAQHVTPMRTFLDQGLMVGGGTDAPVIPHNPFWALYHFVSRDTISDGRYDGSQRISREEALRVFTINNARLTFQEDIKGSLEPGKLADLLVLPADLLTVPEKQIETMRPLATMVGGRFVFTAPGF
jgi:predicted amidohydrolase YtcJ